MNQKQRWQKILEAIRSESLLTSQAAVARRLGVSPGYVSRILNEGDTYTGEAMSADSLAKYETALNIPPDDPPSESESGEFGYVRKVQAQLGLGGSFVTDGGTKAHYAFRKDFFHEVGRPEDLVLFTAQGESMRPTICNGDMVLLNTSKELLPPKEGELWGVRVGNQLMAKRVSLRPGELVLRSDNEQAGGEFSVSTRPESQEDFQLMGKVRWLCRIVG